MMPFDVLFPELADSECRTPTRRDFSGALGLIHFAAPN